ncbi:MAG TPA: porin family protein [Chryseolinea sp.]
MKKLIIVFALVAASVGAYAQASVAIGIKGGVNFAKLDGSTSVKSNFDSRTGYHFGAFTLFKFSKIGIQPEVLFSQQGSKVKTDFGSFDGNFSYINIPVIVKLYTVAGINLQVGPQFGFLSRAEIDDTDVKDSFKKSDISLALGAGWDIPFGITIDARYNLGLTEIDDSPAYANIKNQVWQVSVGYKLFKFGKD